VQVSQSTSCRTRTYSNSLNKYSSQEEVQNTEQSSSSRIQVFRKLFCNSPQAGPRSYSGAFEDPNTDHAEISLRGSCSSLFDTCVFVGSLAHVSNTVTPIEHIFVIMQENHSFDNYFGTYPTANKTLSRGLASQLQSNENLEFVHRSLTFS
jgi:hypothetical protein